MRKVAIALLMVSTWLSALGQGKILLANDSLHLFNLVTTLPADSAVAGPIPISPLPSGLTLIVSLYAGSSSNSMALQTSMDLTGANWLAPGRMSNKSLILSDVPGASAAFFQIVLTDNTGLRPGVIDAATVNAMTFGGYYVGTSGLFTAIPATGLSYPNICTSASSSTWTGAIQITLTTNPPNTSLGLYAGITIYGVPGHTYGIEYGTDLANTNSWQSLTNITLTQSPEIWVDTSVDVHSATNQQRFYRVTNQ